MHVLHLPSNERLGEGKLTLSSPTSLHRLQEFLAKLPDMIHQNITVKGLSWEEHEARSNQGESRLSSSMCGCERS